MSGKVIKNIVEPRKKSLSYIWQMIKNFATKDKSIDTRRDSFGGSKVIGHAGTRSDPAKILNKKIEEEK